MTPDEIKAQATSATAFDKLSPEAQQYRMTGNIQSPPTNGTNLATSTPPPASTGFNFQMPTLFSGIDLNKALETPFTQDDTRRLIEDQRAYNLRIAELMKPSERELQLQQQIGGIIDSAEGASTQLAGRSGIDLFTLGRGVSQIERDASTLSAPLQRQLGLEQGKRQSEIQGQQFLSAQTQDQIQFAQQANQQAFQRFQIIAQQVQQLQDNARQAFNSIITNFGGLAFTDLDTQTQQQLRQIATNAGLPAGILEQGLATIKEQQLAQRELTRTMTQAKREQQSNSSNFTETQINKGAANAGMTLSDFTKLDPDSQNIFINGATQLKQRKGLIDEAKENDDDPRQIEKEISESVLPPAVKDYLVRYLKEVFKEEYENFANPKLPWWKRLFQ